MSGGSKQRDVRARVIEISAAIYIAIAIIALALVPATEGRSLSVFCGIFVAIGIEGIIYTIFS
jgi:hypothetical protein